MQQTLDSKKLLSELPENKNILEKVCTWDFSEIVEKLKSNKPDLANRAESLVKQYQLYMYLRAVDNFRLPMTCTDIDAVWETHLLFTEDYDNFCQKIKGEKIHHKPSSGKHYCDGACKDLLQMEQLYNEHFGDNGFWGGSVNICW